MRELSISPAHPDQDTPPATSVEPTAGRLADAESSLKDVLRPLLRRWIDENMAKAFEPSLARRAETDLDAPVQAAPAPQ